MYDINAMRQALKDCDKNIAIFEQAIAAERKTKREYQKILTNLIAKQSESDDGACVKH